MKLHLGCGERYLEGYTHIDLADFEHIDYKMPVDNLSIFENNSIDEIYASHVIEYFDRDEVKLLLKEWNRVLIDGGILRIAVPNFENLIKVYEMTGNIDNILGPLFGKWNATNENTIYHKQSTTKIASQKFFKMQLLEKLRSGTGSLFSLQLITMTIHKLIFHIWINLTEYM